MNAQGFADILATSVVRDAAPSAAGAAPDDARMAEAVLQGAGLMALSEFSRWRVRGADRARFLHGQCTQEVKSLAPGQGGAGFVLDGRGRNLGELRFSVREDDLWCTLAPGEGPALRSWLERFIISADVEIIDAAPTHDGLLVAGPGAARLLGELLSGDLPARDDFGRTCRFGDALVFVVGDDQAGPGGFDVWFPRDAIATAGAALVVALRERGAIPAPPAVLDLLRIIAGRPRFGVDLDEGTLPKESGQESRTVSYTKGCYAGQEVVAKQHFLGKPRRMVVALAWSGDALPPGTPIHRGAETVGQLTSSCQVGGEGHGIATLRPDAAEPAATLSADVGGRAITLTLRGAPRV